MSVNNKEFGSGSNKKKYWPEKMKPGKLETEGSLLALTMEELWKKAADEISPVAFKELFDLSNLDVEARQKAADQMRRLLAGIIKAKRSIGIEMRRIRKSEASD